MVVKQFSPSTKAGWLLAAVVVWGISLALIAHFHPILLRSFERLQFVFLKDMWFVKDQVLAETFPASVISPFVTDGGPCQLEDTAQRLLKVEPHSELRLVSCRCWEERKQDAEAQVCYDHFLTRFDNASLGAYEGLSRLYVKKGEPQAALDLVDRGLKIFEEREKKYRVKGDYYAYSTEGERSLAVYYANVDAIKKLQRLKQQLAGGTPSRL